MRVGEQHPVLALHGQEREATAAPPLLHLLLQEVAEVTVTKNWSPPLAAAPATAAATATDARQHAVRKEAGENAARDYCKRSARAQRSVHNRLCGLVRVEPHEQATRVDLGEAGRQSPFTAEQRRALLHGGRRGHCRCWRRGTNRP